MPYAVVAIYHPGEDRAQIMSANGRIVLFDNLVIAQQVVPILGAGRLCAFDADGETAYFTPIDPQGVNRIAICPDYDPYNLPPGMPVKSEARSLEWKHHVMWTSVFFDIGQMRRRQDGTWANEAIGEQ